MGARSQMRWLLVLAAAVGLMGTGRAYADEPAGLRVMTFNLWHGGDAGKQPLEQTARVIRAAGADVVGLQETAGIAKQGEDRPDNAAKLAKLLDWHYVDQGGRTGIISRYPIAETTPAKWGARIEHPGGRPIYLFNAHFAPMPYQPYQLLNIPYGDHPFLKTEAEAIESARSARGGAVGRMLAEVKAVDRDGAIIFVTGDFNEPSWQDWTPAAHAAGRCPIAVAWPTTKAVTDAGFVDAYREIHPDPVRRPGLTWTPISRPDDPKDRHDRIDFVFKKGEVAVKAARVVGEAEATADVVVTPYPSDHRSVVVTVEVGGK